MSQHNLIEMVGSVPAGLPSFRREPSPLTRRPEVYFYSAAYIVHRVCRTRLFCLHGLWLCTAFIDMIRLRSAFGPIRTLSKRMKLALLATAALLTPQMAVAQQVFDDHVHLWHG
jgi:hypothetical protein